MKRIADRVTVMRDARVISTREAAGISEHDIAYLMVGREISFERINPPQSTGNPALSVRDLSYTDDEGVRALSNVSFDIRAGEILGIAGVEGNGQTELVRILTGLLSATTGAVTIGGKPIRGLAPREIRELEVAHIPEDRMEDGAAGEATIQENVIVDRYYKNTFSQGPRLRWPSITRHTNDLIQRFAILAKSARTRVGSLSGGNIQKVVVARELSSNPEVDHCVPAHAGDRRGLRGDGAQPPHGGA